MAKRIPGEFVPADVNLANDPAIMAAETGRQASTRWGIWGGYTPVERVMLERMQGRVASEAGVQVDKPECQVELTHNRKAAPAGNRSLTATTNKES